jgi:hypothetical protein
MDIVIKKLKEKALSGMDIYNTCEKQIKILRNSKMHTFKNIDEVFYPYNAVALLYETAPNNGHWVLLIKYADTIEFFDSYGYFIDDQIKYIDDDFLKKSNQSNRYLSKLLLDSPYKIIYNNTQIQQKKDGVSSCGRHLCLRYMMRDTKLKDYINIIKKSNLKNTDDVVTYLTAFI